MFTIFIMLGTIGAIDKNENPIPGSGLPKWYVLVGMFADVLTLGLLLKFSA